MSLQKKTWKNLGVVSGLQALSSLFQTVTSIVLARILFPEDFGILALAQTFILFVQRFQDFGLGTAIVQKKGEVEDLLYTANAFRTIISLVLVAACFALGPSWSAFYGEGSIGQVIRLLSLAFILNSAVFIPRSLMRRAMEFKSIFKAEASGTILASILKIALALSGAGLWSIPIGTLAGQVLTTLLSHLLRPYPFRFRFRKAAAIELYRFSRFLVIAGIVMFVSTNLDRMTVGKALGLVALGYFDVGYRWGTWLTQQIARVVPRVVLPTLSRIQTDIPRLRRGILKVTEVITVVSAPLFLGLAAVAPDFLETVIGARWLPSATTLRIATLCGLFRCMQAIPRTFLVSVGEVRHTAISAGVTLGVTVAAIFPLTFAWGIEGAAAAVSLAAFAGFLALVPPTIRKLEIGLGAYARRILPSLFAAVVMAAAVAATVDRASGLSAPVRLAMGTLVGAAFYPVVLCLITRRSLRAWKEHLRPGGSSDQE